MKITNQRIEKIYAFLIFVCWLFTALLRVGTDSGLIVALTWFVLGMLVMLYNKKIIIRYSHEQIVWLLFIIYTFVATCLNIFIGTENNYSNSLLINEGISQYLVPLVVTFLLINFILCRQFFLIFRNFCIISAVVGLFEYLTKTQFYSNWIRTESALYNFTHYGSVRCSSYRMTLIFYHPIYYSIILAIGLICLLYLPLKNKLLNLLAMLLIGSNLVLTQSRTGWIVTVLIFFLFLLKNKKIRITDKKILSFFKWIFFSIVILMIIGLCTNFYETILSILSIRIKQMFTGEAVGARIENLKLISLILKGTSGFLIVIFGGGNRFAISYLQNHPMINSWTRAIDNQYVTNFLNYGLIGEMLFILFFILVLYKYFRFERSPEREVTYLATLAIMISGFFYEPIGSNIICYVLMILVSQMADEVYRIKINNKKPLETES